MAVAEITEPASEESEPESTDLSTDQVDGSGSSLDGGTADGDESGSQDGGTADGDKQDQEPDLPISAEELMEILEFREQRAERARQAEAQGGQPQGGAQPAQAAAQTAQAQPPAPVGPFKMTEEMKKAFGEEGDFDGGFNAFGNHIKADIIGEVRGSRNEVVDDALGALCDELAKSMGGIQASMMEAAENAAEMRLFLNPKLYPDNADIAEYGKDVFGCAMRQASREMPDASIVKRQERAAEIIRKDGVRAIKAIRSGKVIDQRPGRKPASDSPRTGGSVSSIQQRQQLDPVTKYWDSKG